MTQAEFHVLVFASIIGFPISAYVIHIRHGRRHELDGFRLIQLGFAGATFPTFLLLFVGLVIPEVRDVLADQDIFLALAGFAGAVLTLRHVFPEPIRGPDPRPQR